MSTIRILEIEKVPQMNDDIFIDFQYHENLTNKKFWVKSYLGFIHILNKHFNKYIKID